MSEYILEMKNITKTFPGVKALDNVNFKVRKGEIHALCGENGAGKSTLMKILSGVYPCGEYEGEIIYRDKPVAFRKIKDSEELGIAIIHQELALIPYLSIAENIFLGNEISKNGVIDREETLLRTKKLMDEVDLRESPSTLIANIGVGKQQLTEIAKALSKHVELLVLDEPTAALNDEESNRLLELLLEFKKRGITSIMISHKLGEVTSIADSITVLRDGASIETIDCINEGASEDRIIKSMVGRELTDRFPIRDATIGDILFEVKNWTAYHPLQDNRKVSDDINIKIRRGEVVGIAGLMGSGRTEFAMSLFGRSYGKRITGEAYMNGKKVSLHTPSEAIKNGLAYVTEDRKTYGLVLISTIKNNVTMSALNKVSRRGVLNDRAEMCAAEEQRVSLKIKTPNIMQKVGNLSGGNQQKVILGKCIFADPEVLILDEPTRGIDVGAKYEVYSIINSLAEQGKSVLVISSEMSELLGICDRLYVMNEGQIKGELAKEEATQEKIMKMIVS
ncbi:MAG: multiple monosaccharide ABC transporter ATP-binding protein [Christensenellales bacterium]|jgi:putative multiple sugar transport system ATP-binding protein